MHERGVRAVLQEAAHEVRQKRLVRPDRRVDAARHAELVRSHDLVVERLAHAVQALVLELGAAGKRADGADREGIVRCELRIYRAGGAKQASGASEIRNVGVLLARKNGIVGQAVDLRALDLRIPIRALDQAHHQPVPGSLAEVDHPVENGTCAPLVGLDDKSDAIPAGKLRIGCQRFQNVERQIEAIGFLRIDVEANVP